MQGSLADAQVRFFNLLLRTKLDNKRTACKDLSMSREVKTRAPRNRTITLTDSEERDFGARCVKVSEPCHLDGLLNKTINQDNFTVLDKLPAESVDLIFADPPYNLIKSFNGRVFSWKSSQDYEHYLDEWIPSLVRLLKPHGTIYICGDWRSSSAIHRVAERYLKVRNRITWEREKGRGAKANWKNSSEDMWYCTKSNVCTFNLDAVKLKRRIVAPYADKEGKPKDWENTQTGNFRLTHPSNLWTDLTVPFWSMPEKRIPTTRHKSRKNLLRKLYLLVQMKGILS